MQNTLRPIAAIWLLLAAFLAPALHAQSPATPKPGDTGTLIGTIQEITSEFLLLQPATGTPQRLWFKWISPTGALDDRSAQPTVATLKPGDSVEAQWSFDGQRRLESIKLAARRHTRRRSPPRTRTPLFPPRRGSLSRRFHQRPQPQLPILSPLLQLSENSTGDRVRRALLDNLVATGDRRSWNCRLHFGWPPPRLRPPRLPCWWKNSQKRAACRLTPASSWPRLSQPHSLAVR